MPKTNRPGSQQVGPEHTSKDEKQQQGQVYASLSAKPTQPKGKQSGKQRKPTIGGTAIQGARATQPKEVPTGPTANQKPEFYNRETRRRMQHMGTGPYNDQPNAADLRDQRKKRLKARQDKMKALVDAKGPSRDIKIGWRNTYFLIALAVLIVLVLVIFGFIRGVF